MMYPFLSAILPALTPAHAPEISVEEFDTLAGGELSAAQLKTMRSWDDPDVQVKLPLYREMHRFRQCLCYRMAVIRADKLKINADFEIPEILYGEIDHALAAAANAAPLKREQLLDAALWRKLDELEICHEMDFEHLCIYRIRLTLLQKYAGRSDENGLKNFETALDKLAGNFNEP